MTTGALTTLVVGVVSHVRNVFLAKPRFLDQISGTRISLTVMDVIHSRSKVSTHVIGVVNMQMGVVYIQVTTVRCVENATQILTMTRR